METPALVRMLGQLAVRTGRALDSAGLAFQDKLGAVDRLLPSTRVVAVKGKSLEHGVDHFVASSASLIGDVHMGERSAAWYGATVRADFASVKIGRSSAIMDNAVVTSSKDRPTTIGEEVTICSGAIVQSASVGDGSMIGMGAVIQAGAVVGAGCYVDAGAVVPAGARIPAGQLWSGAPARQLRALSADELAFLRATAASNASLGLEHAAQGAKSTEALERDAEIRLLKLEGGFAPDTPISEPDADVVEYYRLTAPGDQHGLFRSKEYDYAAELAAREADELAMDRAEEQLYNEMVANKRRLGEGTGAPMQ